MLGYNPNTILSVNPLHVGKYNPLHAHFAEQTRKTLSLMINILKNPMLSESNPGKDFPKLEKLLDEINSLSEQFLNDMQNRYKNKNGEQKIETVPYLQRVLDKNSNDTKMALDLFTPLFFAGVDTTHHVLAFLILNLAKHSDSQEKLYQELKQHVGDIQNFQEDHLRLPYLVHFLRESHRYSPPQYFFTFRKLPKSITLDGYEIPAETKLTMMLSPIQLDPDYVDEPDQFKPERWDSDQVLKRKGTPKEIIDHPLLAKPFGYGSRMCIGARLAEVELKMALAKLTLDWKVSLDANSPPYQIVQETMFAIRPFPKLVFEKRKSSW